MCEKCDIEEFQRFDTYQIHEEFDLKLTKKLAKEELKDLGFSNGYNTIVCQSCKQKFHYSTPDQARRGFFLKDENFIPPKNTDIADKNKKVLSWIIYILTVLVLIWLLN